MPDPRLALPLGPLSPPAPAADPNDVQFAGGSPAPDPSPQFLLPLPSAGAQSAPMPTQYLIDTVYSEETGDHVYPRAGAYQAAGVKVTEHGGKWTKIVQWTVEQVGGEPVQPHWDTGDPNDVLVRKIRQPASLLAGSNGRYVYRRSGRYEYDQINKPDQPDGGGLVCGFCPYDATQQVVIGGAVYSKAILKSK